MGLQSKPLETSMKVGSGTIVKRAKKNGSFSFQAKVRKNGVNVSQTFTSLKEAKEFITLTDSKILKGESISALKAKKITLGEIFQDYIDGEPLMPLIKKQRLTKITQEIGNVPLASFKTKGFQDYINFKLAQEIPDQKTKKKDYKGFDGNRTTNAKGEVVKKTYKSSTIRKFYYDIRTALQWHSKINDYHFDSKPFDDVDPPPSWENPRTRRLEDGELDRLLQACDKLYVNGEESKCLIQFLTFSAFRIGETMLIRWKDIKLNEKKPEESYIFIPKAHQKTAKKKGAEDRYASMRPELFHLIKNQMMKWKKSDDDLIFPFWAGPHYFYTRFRIICKNAKSKDLTLHDLRHEGCSWFFENSTLSDIEISKITGHIELDTLKRYANLRPHKVGAKLWASLENSSTN
jgi:integrase